MRLGVVQSHPAFLDLETTCERLKPQLDFCATEKADLLILPELANSGYSFTSKAEALQLAEPADGTGPFLSFLIEHCRHNQCEMVVGFAEQEGNSVYNSAALLDPEGVQAVYRKLHLFHEESNWFLPGDAKPAVIERPWGKLTILICYDWAFPELWRQAGLDGADLIAHPSNLVLPFAQRAVVGHALCNRISIATVNRIGAEKFKFTGGSQLLDSEGVSQFQTDTTKEGQWVVDWDPACGRNKRPTDQSHLFEDRRPEFYSQG